MARGGADLEDILELAFDDKVIENLSVFVRYIPSCP
jgi:hypothetical protein